MSVAESNDNCSTPAAAGQADHAMDQQDMKQLNENFRSLNTTSAADVVADSGREDDGAIEQQQVEEGKIRAEGDTDKMSLHTRVAKLIAPQPDSDVGHEAGGS